MFFVNRYGDQLFDHFLATLAIVLLLLVDQIKVMGLTPRELKITLENVLTPITPKNLTVNQLLEAIQTDVVPVEYQESTAVVETTEGQ